MACLVIFVESSCSTKLFNSIPEFFHNVWDSENGITRSNSHIVFKILVYSKEANSLLQIFGGGGYIANSILLLPVHRYLLIINKPLNK